MIPPWMLTLLAPALAGFSAGLIGWALTQRAWGSLSSQRIVFNPILKRLGTLSLVQKFLILGLVACFLVILFIDYTSGFILLVFLSAGWFFHQKGPAYIKKIEAKKKQEKMVQFFPQTLGMAIQALKTGQTVPQIIDYLSKESPEPLKEEWNLVRSEMDLGSSAEQALTKMAQRYPYFQEFHQFLESYKISRQTGANLTNLLQVLVEGMEEKNRLVRKMESMTAQARLSGLLVGCLPFLLALVLFFMDPTLIIPLFTQKMGWGILVVAMTLETIGFLWIRQLLQFEV